MATRLVNLFVKNVAAVDKPANRRTFLVVKDEHAPTFDDAMFGRRLHQVYMALGEHYGALMETIEGIRHSEDTEKAGAVKTAIDAFMTALKSAMPEALAALGVDVEKAGRKISAGRMAKLRTLYKTLGEIIAEQEEYDMDKHQKAPDAGALMTLGHSIAALFGRAAGADDAALAVVDKAAGVESAIAPETQAALAKAAADNTALTTRLEKAEAETKKLRDEAELRKFAEEVSGYQNIGLDPTKDAALLKAVTELLPKEQSDRIREIFKAAVAQKAASALFGELGSSGSGAPADSAAAEVEQKAALLMQKNETLTCEHARAQVFHATPGLYDRWRQETSVKI